MRYFLDGKVAVTVITNDDKKRLDLREEDLGILSSITREISGVEVGITIKQSKSDASKYKISVRSEQSFPRQCAVCFVRRRRTFLRRRSRKISASNPKIAIATVIKHLADSDHGVIIV